MSSAPIALRLLWIRANARSGIGVGAERVGPELGEDFVALVGVDQLAGGRAAEVGVGRVALEPQPHRSDRLGSRSRPDREYADQAKVDMDDAVVAEGQEQVLAGRLRRRQPMAVDEPGLVDEAPLWA